MVWIEGNVDAAEKTFDRAMNDERAGAAEGSNVVSSGDDALELLALEIITDSQAGGGRGPGRVRFLQTRDEVHTYRLLAGFTTLIAAGAADPESGYQESGYHESGYHESGYQGSGYQGSSNGSKGLRGERKMREVDEAGKGGAELEAKLVQALREEGVSADAAGELKAREEGVSADAAGELKARFGSVARLRAAFEECNSSDCQGGDGGAYRELCGGAGTGERVVSFVGGKAVLKAWKLLGRSADKDWIRLTPAEATTGPKPRAKKGKSAALPEEKGKSAALLEEKGKTAALLEEAEVATAPVGNVGSTGALLHVEQSNGPV
ncbi:hypothetical protein T484DRAFT_1832331 [Baffinella frigidus]|nr:hypothetical protein T484DRAFT_1832331 [Cryptophyta sp. CCMP2293]